MIENPFVYDDPNWVPQKKAEKSLKRRLARQAKLGRPVGEHGGQRPGAGRKRKAEHTVTIRLNSIQQKMLEQDGSGKLSYGIQKLINKHY